jgi:hypothetical protein
MADELKIKIIGKLNTGATIGEINTAIKGIEKKINQIKLKVDIDQNVLNTVKTFNEQFKKIEQLSKNTGKVIEETLLPDGTKTKRTFFDGLKGEFSETTSQIKKQGKEQLKAVDEIAEGYDKLAKSVERYNSQQKKIGETITVSDSKGINSRTITANNKGKVTGYTDTYNANKEIKEREKVVREEQKLIEQMANFREQSNQRKLQEDRKLAEAQRQAINKNAELERQEIVKSEKARKDYEQWWTKSLKDREIKHQKSIDKMTQDLRRYQENAKIDSSKLLRTHSNTVDSTALNNWLKSVNSLNAQTPDLNNKLKDMSLRFKSIKAEASEAARSSMTFGDMLGQAMTKFPINFWVGIKLF